MSTPSDRDCDELPPPLGGGSAGKPSAGEAAEPGDRALPGGELGALVRGFDWSSHPLGPPERWPQALRSYLSMVLEMPTPAIIFWGDDLLQLYNDGYAVIMGPRHPRYFAAPYRECWPDTYPVIHPWMRRVLDRGETIQVTDELFVLTRHGFTEEAYFTFTFSPLRDDAGKIAGVLQPVVEVTSAVLAERRARALGLLASRPGSVGEALSSFGRAVAAAREDLPFALIFLPDPQGRKLQLASWHGLSGEGDPPHLGGMEELANRVWASGASQQLDGLDEALDPPHRGVWPEVTREAIGLPLGGPAGERPRGVVILGLSPRLRFDERYEAFVVSLGRQLAAGLAAGDAEALEADLLDREQAARREAELQKEHLVGLLTQAPTPMAVLRGPRFVVELANPMTCQLWQRSPEQVIDRPLFEALPELRGQGFEELLEKVFRNGVTHVGRETPAEISGPDGTLSRVFLSFAYAPLRRADGDIDGVLVIAFDVTEQVIARQQLDELRGVAEAANRAKDEFFAILGHELRNPLAPIFTALELIRMQSDGRLEKERQVIERQAQHLVRLVDDLLDVSRIARGKIELRKERNELIEIVRRAVEMTLPLLEKREQQLSIAVPAEGLVVDADPVRLSQAFANLLTNAAKYSDRGDRVEVAATRRGAEIEVTVRDQGVGIAPEMLPHIFELFVQERQALDRSAGGLGLGLSIVRGIVELHGGSVAAHSDGLGKGAEMIVRLPAAPGVRAGTGRTPRPTSDAETGADGLVLLVVDDNRDAADLLATRLGQLGHRPHVAYDAAQALRLAPELKPDLALLDIGLPVIDGYELARRLRGLPGLERLPLVAITGYGAPEDRERSAAAGFDAHLTKPVDGDGLMRVLERLGPRGDADPVQA